MVLFELLGRTGLRTKGKTVVNDLAEHDTCSIPLNLIRKRKEAQHGNRLTKSLAKVNMDICVTGMGRKKRFT